MKQEDFESKAREAMNRKERMTAIANEYAKAVGNLIGYEPEYWVAQDVSIDVCCYGETYFFSLADMQIIVDHMDEWMRMYGTNEKVSEAVIAWIEYTVEDSVDENGLYRTCPRINLWSWLKGLRPEQLKWGDMDELTKLETQLKVLRTVAETYPTASIQNVIVQIDATAKSIRKRHEAETMKTMKQLSAYNDFMNELNLTKTKNESTGY